MTSELTPSSEGRITIEHDGEKHRFGRHKKHRHQILYLVYHNTGHRVRTFWRRLTPGDWVALPSPVQQQVAQHFDLPVPRVHEAAAL